MARNIGMGLSTPLYRTVVVATYTDEAVLADEMRRYRRTNNTMARDGLTLTWYEGPYNLPGKAQSRMTIWTGVYAAKSAASLECHVEMRQPQWQRLPGRTAPRSRSR
ncbi:hypothetical protein [Streptomyces yaizuensis]|uniref:Uncharacterized protein n=1 Tax=Streptomyces yaizuensis TaxID=2989713 RepID=A0ABQ5PBG0_9ACTN|nr:hypothetical protein [Streptomyces sp. YSPA8]GLF99919.1 hypothetical protein SYYSPA8_36500 [Streptomyces sp. YSPA8]